MAKVDWESSRDQLSSAISGSSLEGAELSVAVGVRDRLEAVGIPYNAVYTNAVNVQKATDEIANSVALGAWAASTELVHDDVVKAIQYAEDKLGTAATIPLPPFDDDAQKATKNKSTLLSRITGTTTSSDVDLVKVMIDYRSALVVAYASRPTLIYDVTLGVVKTVNVSADESLTVVEAEVILIAEGTKTDELLSELSFVP